LQVENENGQLEVVNGLGAPVESLWLADSAGKIFRAYNIDAGQKAKLVSGSSRVTDQLGARELLRETTFTAQRNNLASSAEKYLLPGTYIAELDGNPFIENALASSSPKRTKSSAVVFGILDSPEAK
jgi:hypothetical protein